MQDTEPRPRLPMDAHPGETPGLPAWGWCLIGLGCLLAAAFAAVLAWGVSAGIGIFEEDALVAMQENAVITRYIGTVETAKVDYLRTGMLPSANGFALRVTGSRASGVVEAEFLTTFEGERLGRGTLRLDDGREFALPGRAD